MTAFETSLALGADVVIVMDGDGQMDPADLRAMIEPIADGSFDVAKGQRFDGVRPRGTMPTGRWIGNLVLSAATRLASGWWAPLDSQCGYVALSAAGLSLGCRLASCMPVTGFRTTCFSDRSVQDFAFRACRVVRVRRRGLGYGRTWPCP